MTDVIIPVQQQAYYPNPAYYLGQLTADPSSPTVGQWWYRVDTGQLKMYTNNGIVILQYESTEIISNNTTIGGTNVTVTSRIVVLPNVTLTVYGSITFTQDVVIFGTLLSSNPSASSSSTQTNYYAFYGTLYLDGTYTTAQYNTDQINKIGGLNYVNSAGTFSLSGTLSFNYNVTLPFSVSGTGTLLINSGYMLTFTGNSITSNLTINGTLALSGNYTLGVNIPNVSGTLIINSGYTLTVSSNITLAYTTISGAGTLSISSGYTLTINNNSTFSISNISGAGTLSISSGYTLTIASNINVSGITVSGAGTLSISSGYTLTQSGAITVSISTINISGTWANAGYGITIPSGATVTWNVSGSVTTASTAGTLTINGTCYWYGNGITTSTSNAQATFILSLTGTGIFIGAPAGKQTATNAISLSSTAVNANSVDGSATGSGGIPYYSLSAVKGSAVGKYTLGINDATANTINAFVLIYIGTANTTYTVSGYFGYTSADKSGNTIYVINTSGSAGTITLTGALYV